MSEISRSYPYLSIANKHGASYGLVLALADRVTKDQPISFDLMPDRLRSAFPADELTKLYPRSLELMLDDILEARRHFQFVCKYGIHMSSAFDRYRNTPRSAWPEQLPDDIPFPF